MYKRTHVTKHKYEKNDGLDRKTGHVPEEEKEKRKKGEGRQAPW